MSILYRSVSDVQAKRTQWRERDLNAELERLVFLDESGVNIDLSRRYGRSIGQARVVDRVPLNTPKRLTILSSVRYDGRTMFTTYQGGTSGERFVAYLKKNLIPTLKAGDIVIMDMDPNWKRSFERMVMRDMIERFLLLLTPRERAVTLRKLREQPEKEICAALQMTPNAVRLHWYRAKKRLRAKVEEN